MQYINLNMKLLHFSFSWKMGRPRCQREAILSPDSGLLRETGQNKAGRHPQMIKPLLPKPLILYTCGDKTTFETKTRIIINIATQFISLFIAFLTANVCNHPVGPIGKSCSSEVMLCFLLVRSAVKYALKAVSWLARL